MVSERRLKELEPNARGVLGLLSAESGIVDSHVLMSFLQKDAAAGGVTFGYGCNVQQVTANPGGFLVEMTNYGAALALRAGVVANAAGLDADRVAQSAGIDIDSAGYRIHPAKGEYFSVSSRHRGRPSRSIYPVPFPFTWGHICWLDGVGIVHSMYSCAGVMLLTFHISASGGGDFCCSGTHNKMKLVNTYTTISISIHSQGRHHG